MSHEHPEPDFYRVNVANYCVATVKLDMSRARERFLKLVKPGGHILDAGCGSGRDMRFFQTQGFTVSGFDGSPEMAAFASLYTGHKCMVLRFQEMHFNEVFDGVWSCAALLHVPKREMHDVMERCSNSLKPNGVLYASFIEGEGERVSSDGRLYNSYTSETLRALVRGTGTLKDLDLWTSTHDAPQTKPAPWLNVIAQKL